VAVLTLTFGVVQYFLGRANEKWRNKMSIYQAVIAAAENIREAYFVDEPDPRAQVGKQGWEYEDGKGWTRPYAWDKSPEYLQACSKLNSALAALSLFASEEIFNKCAIIESIAIDYRDSANRKNSMNEIVGLFKKDLKYTHKFSSNPEFVWY
jgi:hypothetical protein